MKNWLSSDGTKRLTTMGCFNFDCCKCGEGISRDEDGNEWEGREYFGVPVRIKVPLKDGCSVILEGTYSGYGEVEVGFGDKTLVFYPKQFQGYWDVWNTKDQYVSEEVYCEDCMEEVPLTSRKTFDGKDFTLALNYMMVNEKPPGWMNPHRPSKWNIESPVTSPTPAPSQPAPVPKQTSEPKSKKAELAKQVVEMKTEFERLRPLETRFTALEAELNALRENIRAKNEILEKVRRAVNT